jgi:uncharacterized membrane protein SpoIIM required for sporulation
MERGDNKFKNLISITAIILFLFTSCIYFFAIISQFEFCGPLPDNFNSSSTSTSSTDYLTDDDSSYWIKFDEILNFNNYLIAMFTLFQITVLGVFFYLVLLLFIYHY